MRGKNDEFLGPYDMILGLTGVVPLESVTTTFLTATRLRQDKIHPVPTFLNVVINSPSLQIDILLIGGLRVMVEVAGFALLGQGLLALLAGKYRHDNLFYKILKTVTGPVVRVARFITPRFIIDAHVPMVTFFLLFWLWIALAFARKHLCGLHELAC